MPLDELQSRFTDRLLKVGPGLLVEPGLRLLGVDGTLPGVWKYSEVVNDEQPLLLHAATFQRYRRPSSRVTEYDELEVWVSTTNWFVPRSRTPTS